MKKFYFLLLIFEAMFCNGQTPSTVAGEIKGPFIWKSKIYPGTERKYWIYVPKEYNASTPACTMVVQDGLTRATGWRLPGILDSLIALKEIPVIIGIFIDHGKVPSIGAENYPRFNRSVEYDGMGDTYARFLLEEILPEVSKSYNLSKDPNDRLIAGASSGAICAFNVAWERPDQFRRVLSTIGTYVGLRGGDEFATLVRKTEPKPLRIFLQDGTKDLNIYAGDWWMANQNMLSALTWQGYEVNHAWGEGAGHDSKHAAFILADALKWLWKDYPAPVKTSKTSKATVNPLVENENWKEIPNVKAEKLTVGKGGEIFFSDRQAIYKLSGDIDPAIVTKLKGIVGGIAVDSNGKVYACDMTQQKIFVINEKSELVTLVSNAQADFITLTNKGVYFSETSRNRIGFYSFEKKATTYVDVPNGPTGLAVSAEQTFLNVGLKDHVFAYSLKILDDGKLSFGQHYIHYHIPYGKSLPDAGGMTVDSENLLYTATSMCIQLSDQLGRVNFIFSKPAEGCTDVKLGGTGFSTLFTTCNGKLYARKIAFRGILSDAPPVKPPRPGM